MDKYEYVLKELKRRAGERQLVKVSMNTGVCRRTIGNILEGKNVTLNSINVLHSYLKKKCNKDYL